MPHGLSEARADAQRERESRLERGFSEGSQQQAVDPYSEITDPKRQDEILHPESLKFTLRFDDGATKEIYVKTAAGLTPKNVIHRRILDEIASLRDLILARISSQTPDRRPQNMEWINANRQMFGWAASDPDVLEMGRKLIAKLSDCEYAEISEGMSRQDVASVNIALLALLGTFEKNAARATPPPESEPAQSTRA